MPDIYPTGLSQDHTFLLCLSVSCQYADTNPLGGALGTYPDRWPKVFQAPHLIAWSDGKGRCGGKRSFIVSVQGLRRELQQSSSIFVCSRDSGVFQ